MAFSSACGPAAFGSRWWDLCDYPSSISDQHFGTVLLDHDVHPPSSFRGYMVLPRTQAAMQASGQSQVKNEKDVFQVMLNVSHFKPEEIQVKIVDNHIVISGKHEEKSDDHGFIQREFVRRYILPEGTEADTVKSSLSGDGILTVDAPKKLIEAPPSIELVVPIKVLEAVPDAEKK